MFRKILLVALGTVVVAAPAYAARTTAPASSGPASWTGYYAGATLGANWNDAHVKIPIYPSKFDIDTSAFLAGGKLGYNYQVANYVFGLEKSMEATFNEGSHASGAGTESYKASQDWQGALVARVGYALGDKFLPYVKGGLGIAHMTDMHYDPELGFGKKSHTYFGWTAGAGVDYALTNNWIVGVDYAYAAYESHEFTYAGPTSIRPTTNTVKASLSYKFNSFF